MSVQAGEAPGTRVELASRSDVGQVRSANEDSCDTFERADGTRLLVVADGMGGHQGGATASRTTVATIAEIFDRDAHRALEEMIEDAIQTANGRVFEMAQQDPQLEGMGTTVVVLLLGPTRHAMVAHVGDSRAYRYRRGQLEPLTTDHSVVAEMHRRGLISADEAATHPRRNEILRSVGVLPAVEIEISRVDVAAGDRFVLCSDGLSGVVTDDEIAAIVQSETPASAVDRLIALANERGGPDNITVQVLSIPASDVEGDPEATAPVELSEVGIQAIENKRRERRRTRQLGSVVVAFGILAVFYFLSQLLGSQAAPPRSPAAPTDGDAPTPTPSPDAGSFEPFPSDPEAPRRGVPR